MPYVRLCQNILLILLNTLAIEGCVLREISSSIWLLLVHSLLCLYLHHNLYGDFMSSRDDNSSFLYFVTFSHAYRRAWINMVWVNDSNIFFKLDVPITFNNKRNSLCVNFYSEDMHVLDSNLCGRFRESLMFVSMKCFV
jgi:hypothetical protein